jgi:hypothetical protein
MYISHFLWVNCAGKIEALFGWGVTYVCTGVLEEIATFIIRIFNSYILKMEAVISSKTSAPAWKSRMSKNLFQLIFVPKQHKTVIQTIPFWY